MELFSFAGMLFLVIVFGALVFAASRYQRCPSNKVIVVYGKVAGSAAARSVHVGGGLGCA